MIGKKLQSNSSDHMLWSWASVFLCGLFFCICVQGLVADGGTWLVDMLTLRFWRVAMLEDVTLFLPLAFWHEELQILLLVDRSQIITVVVNGLCFFFSFFFWTTLNKTLNHVFWLQVSFVCYFGLGSPWSHCSLN